MHQCKIVFVLYSDLCISKDKRSVRSIHSYSYNVTCLEAPLFYLFSSDMYVSLCNDHALFKFEFSGRSNQLDSRGSFKIARESDRCVYAKCSRICLGQFYL